jgi:hypothetical protein
MIQSTSNSNGPVRPDAVTANPNRAPAKRPASEGVEQLSTPNVETLKSALAANPEIRPEALEKGKALRVDGNYPPRAIIEQLSKLLVASPDLTESDT